MERIEILKKSERVLRQIVAKATYDIGRVSHRKDGDWQKTSEGWKRLSNRSSNGSSNQSKVKDLSSHNPSPLEGKQDDIEYYVDQYYGEWSEDSDADELLSNPNSLIESVKESLVYNDVMTDEEINHPDVVKFIKNYVGGYFS